MEPKQPRISKQEHERASQYSVFVRKARQAAHQCLFFLYGLREVAHSPRSKELQQDVEFAFHQIRAIVAGVHIPSQIAARAKEGALVSPAAARPAGRGWHQQIWDFVFESDGPFERETAADEELLALSARLRDRSPVAPAPDSPAQRAAGRQMRGGQAEEVVMSFWAERIWRSVYSFTTSPDAPRAAELAPGPDLESSDARVGYLIVQFQAFLRITRPRRVAYWNHLVRKLGRGFARHASFLLGVLAVLFAWASEVLRSLVLNQPARSAGILVLLLLAPVISLLVGRRIGWLRLGKSAFFRMAFDAHPPERGIEPWPEESLIRRHIALAELIKLSIMGVYAGLMLTFVWGAFEATDRTLFLLGALSGVFLMSMHWLDLWDFLDSRPIRFLVLVLVLVFVLAVLISDRYHLLGALVCGLYLVYFAVQRLRKGWAGLLAKGWAALAAISLVLTYCAHETSKEAVWSVARQCAREGCSVHHGKEGHPRALVQPTDWPFPSRDASGKKLPVVVLAASGGGSRAAIYTALTLQALHQDDDGALREVAANLQAMSSVSGGSLATAAYVAERLRRSGMAAREADGGDLACDGDWSCLVDAVSQDFVYPTLLGALKPGSTRGDEIELAWDREVGLGGITIGSLADAWIRELERTAGQPSGAVVPPFPMPLFNSCTLDGHAVVISPLAGGAYVSKPPPIDLKGPDGVPDELKRLWHHYGLEDKDVLTWVLERDRIHAFDEIGSHYDPTLAESVRASANFPFGFPLVEVATDQAWGPAWLPDERHEYVQLTDGGVLSNSGLWTLFHLLTHRERFPELRERGVLLLVVDASHMPTYGRSRRALTSLYGAIRDQSPVAQNLHRRMFDTLKDRYGEAISIVQIDIVPRISDNVHTTWALDQASRDKLARSFETIWHDERDGGAAAQLRDHVRQQWLRLKQRASGDATPASVAQRGAEPFLRTPLD
jgi:hypothetical protein